ncbi:amidase family protein [Pantoea sp. App145]|uniref:amidase family protein n=1 Tax=Pantoea sp. App145 TaxID=3071567 RepID=UPI003A7FF8D4
MLPDLKRLTATEAAKLICERKITSKDLTEAYLSNIKTYPNLNAFITVTAESALHEAKAYDMRISKGEACLPLGGVPFAVKDNTQVAGLPNTGGTPALRNFVPSTTAPVIRKLQAAGAILIGKTNMQELAYGMTGLNPAYHYPGIIGIRNANDSSRIPGGSSSGSAVAVAAGMATIATGSDTGGSVRQPCALNGCVGFRPTTGRYPREGIIPISHHRDTPGTMAHSVADIALMDQIITNENQNKPKAANLIRLGVASYFWEGRDHDVREKTEQAMKKLRNAGVVIVPVSMPGVGELVKSVSFPVVVHEGKYDLEKYLRDNHTEISIEELAAKIASPDVKKLFDNNILPQRYPDRSGNLVALEPEYKWALTEGIPRLSSMTKDVMETNHLDGLIFPTSPIVAPLSNIDSTSMAMFQLMIHNTDFGSNINLPGLSIPVGKGSSTKMPVALEIDGLPGSDVNLLSVGETLEGILNSAQ